MLQVGLTGNIASGKSYASQVFAELGAHIIDADLIAHGLLAPETHTFRHVVEAFGKGILQPNGTIDRKALGSIIFGQPEKRLLLNRLVHPDVRAVVMRRIFKLEQKNPCGIVIVDAALMVESGFYKLFDRLIVVKCDPSLQLARIVNRDGLRVEEARARMRVQMPVEEKVRLADYTIETSGTFKQTREQVVAIFNALLIEEISLRNSPQS